METVRLQEQHKVYKFEHTPKLQNVLATFSQGSPLLLT